MFLLFLFLDNLNFCGRNVFPAVGGLWAAAQLSRPGGQGGGEEGVAEAAAATPPPGERAQEPHPLTRLGAEPGAGRRKNRQHRLWLGESKSTRLSIGQNSILVVCEC
jgi:hypothetical protein